MISYCTEVHFESSLTQRELRELLLRIQDAWPAYPEDPGSIIGMCKPEERRFNQLYPEVTRDVPRLSGPGLPNHHQITRRKMFLWTVPS